MNIDQIAYLSVSAGLAMSELLHHLGCMTFMDCCHCVFVKSALLVIHYQPCMFCVIIESVKLLMFSRIMSHAL